MRVPALSHRRMRLIDEETVKHIAWLARVEMSEEEVASFVEQLNRILEYFQKLDEAQTEGVEPTFHVLDLVNVFREDEPLPPLSPEEVLKNAPKREGGFFKAPRMVGHG